MDPEYKKQLENQGYRFAGEHTSVKICGWTKKALTGCGTCYKQRFYGIKSHQCVQMTPATNFCDHDCIFCWRSRNNSSFGVPDDPKAIVPESVGAQNVLLNGFPGNEKVDMALYKESKTPKHVAISLNGEPLYYPKLSALIREYHKNGFSTFVVSNGQLPVVLRKLEAPTQFYLSLDAPNEELYKKIDQPMRKDGWSRLMESMDVLKDRKKEMRTAVRITLIKGLNDVEPERYAEILDRGDPHFVEVKAYMFIGSSRQRLKMEMMPYHYEVKEFSERIAEVSGWKIVDEQEESRVVLLMKKDFTMRKIDFSSLHLKGGGVQDSESEEVRDAVAFSEEHLDG